MSHARNERGAASVEHAGLVLLLALLLAGAIALVAAHPPNENARELASAIARKLRCGPRLPGPCWRDPLTEAYGRPVAGAIRALAPVPAARAGLLPVDFRHCRRTSCALPGARPELTASNRRVTVFTAVNDERRGGGAVRIDYWLYRPTLGWERLSRFASAAEVAERAKTPLLESDHPRLVALETLPGRNHTRFAAAEEPPWRWRVTSARRDAP